MEINKQIGYYIHPFNGGMFEVFLISGTDMSDMLFSIQGEKTFFSAKHLMDIDAENRIVWANVTEREALKNAVLMDSVNSDFIPITVFDEDAINDTSDVEVEDVIDIYKGIFWKSLVASFLVCGVIVSSYLMFMV